MRDIDILKQIDRYLKGKLSEEEIDLLWQEFLKNPEYLQWLEIEAAAREFFQKENDGSKNKNSVKRSNTNTAKTDKPASALFNYRYWLYGLAAILAIFVAFHFLTIDRTGLQGYVADTISVDEMATAEIYRSTEDRVSPVDVEINRGFEAAISGRLDESHQIYQSLLEDSLSNSQHAVVNLNYGILLYNKQRYPEAVAAFEAVVEYNDLADYVTEKGWWYLGKSLIMTNELIAARDAVDMVHSLNGRFQSAAENLLNRMDW